MQTMRCMATQHSPMFYLFLKHIYIYIPIIYAYILYICTWCRRWDAWPPRTRVSLSMSINVYMIYNVHIIQAIHVKLPDADDEVHGHTTLSHVLPFP
jgi:hypothetical protein